MVELSKAQDIEAGDGTTTVVVIAGSLLDAASRLVSKGSDQRLNRMKLFSSIDIGLHPTSIADAFEKAADKATEILRSISIPIELSDMDSLHRSASTSLNSKVNELSFRKSSNRLIAFLRWFRNIRIFLHPWLFKPFSRSSIPMLIRMLIYAIFVL